MKKFITILSIIVLLFSVFAIFTVSHADDTTTWTDFSNAKYEITYKQGGEIKITGVNGNGVFFYTITDSKTKPTFNKDEWEMASSAELLVGAGKYIELNQDLYLWIVQWRGADKYQFVAEGVKLERPGYTKDYNLFRNSFISSDGNQIIFNDVAWGAHTRNMKLKIGKVTDTAILNKIKNDANDGFTELLSYSKTATAIYDNNLETSKKTNDYFAGYRTNAGYDGQVIQIPISSLENHAYYYIYATLDDENGKYYPVEGVTLAYATTFPTLAYKPWHLYIFGSNDFKWSEFGNGVSGGESTDTGTGKVEPKTDPGDTTTAPTILPKTGISLTIIIVTLGVVLISLISIKKYKTWKEIK